MAKAPKSNSKEERLAEALRENLRRRKAQGRQRKAEAKTPPPAPTKPPEKGAD